MYEEKRKLSTNDRSGIHRTLRNAWWQLKEERKTCLKQSMTLVADARRIIRLSISEDRSRIGARVSPHPSAKAAGVGIDSSYRVTYRMWTSSNSMSKEKSQTAADGEKEQELRALVAEYENKIDDVARLVSRVRHEINNPLTGVLGQAQLLLREDLSERARKRAETIEQLAIRLRDIAAELRQVQRPQKTPQSDGS